MQQRLPIDLSTCSTNLPHLVFQARTFQTS